MLNLALWLKANGFRADQVQAFLPSPMAMATRDVAQRSQPAEKDHPLIGDRVFAEGTAGSAAIHRHSCVTMTRTTGHCCARHCGRWAGRIL